MFDGRYSPGMSTAANMKGIAIDAATASGKGPLLMTSYWPFRFTTPTAKSCKLTAQSAAGSLASPQEIACAGVSRVPRSTSSPSAHLVKLFKGGRQQELQALNHFVQGQDASTPWPEAWPDDFYRSDSIQLCTHLLAICLWWPGTPCHVGHTANHASALTSAGLMPAQYRLPASAPELVPITPATSMPACSKLVRWLFSKVMSANAGQLTCSIPMRKPE